MIGTATASVPSTVAASTVSGSAASCSGLATCSYSIAEGSASTTVGLVGSVGQNFTFSGGTLTFMLPGEALSSVDPGTYSGTAINTNVFSSTAGLVYKVSGSFAAADYNTGLIVRGSTHGFVGIKGHSGRGGGVTYVLINGTISLTPSSLYATTMQVTCTPTSLSAGMSTVCTATVADLDASASAPTGVVTFSSTSGFSPVKCLLSAGTCSVKLVPVAGTWPVYAAYGGDKVHYRSSGQGPELYVSCPPGGC